MSPISPIPPALSPSAMKLSPSRSSLAVRPSLGRVERSANDFVRDKFVGRRTGIKGADLGGAAAVAAIAVVSGSASICGRGRLFCGLTQRGGARRQVSARASERATGRASERWFLLPAAATLYQPDADARYCSIFVRAPGNVLMRELGGATVGKFSSGVF